jgi:hypothetical protein
MKHLPLQIAASLIVSIWLGALAPTLADSTADQKSDWERHRAIENDRQRQERDQEQARRRESRAQNSSSSCGLACWAARGAAAIVVGAAACKAGIICERR